MRRWSLATATVLGALLAASASMAEVRTLARAGAWEAIGGVATDGNAICGMTTRQSGRAFYVKLFGPNDFFTIQLGSPQWRASEGGKMRAKLQFDAHPTWHAQGVVILIKADVVVFESVVKRDRVERFSSDLRGSASLHVEFENNRFPAWTMNLEGAQQVAEVFDRCVRFLPAS